MKTERNQNIIYMVIALLAIGAIILGVIGLWRHQKSESENSSSRTSSLLDKIMPAPTEESDLDFQNIVICKSEFEGLRARAEKTGAAGMLIMTTHSADYGRCELVIKNMRGIGDLGTVSLSVLQDDGNFDITLKMAADQTEQTRLWAETALLYLNNKISGETAADAVKTALEEGSVTGELFTITVSADAKIDGNGVTPLKVIKIKSSLNELP